MAGEYEVGSEGDNYIWVDHSDFSVELEMGVRPSDLLGVELVTPTSSAGDPSIALDGVLATILEDFYPTNDGYRKFAYFSSGAMGGDRWFGQSPTDGPTLQPKVGSVLQHIEAQLAAYTPGSIIDRGRLRCRPLPPDLWHLSQRKFDLVLEDEDGIQVPALNLGSGSRRWLNIILHMIQAKHAQWFSTADLDEAPTHGDEGLAQLILAIDEPELHIHPRSQRDIARWLVDMSTKVAGILITTHSPHLLSLPSELASYHVLRRRSEQTIITDISTDILSGLDAYTEETGFGREAWITAIRAVLIVEGQHDLDVVTALYGRELKQERIQIVPMRGGRNWRSIVGSEFLGAIGVPIYVLFDNVELGRVESAKDAKSLSEHEEKWAYQLLQQRAAGHDITVLPYDEPDILCALPIKLLWKRFPHVRAAVSSWLGSLPDDWSPLIDAYRHLQISKSFKDWLLVDQLGLNNGAAALTDMIALLTSSDEGSRSLHRAMSSLFAASSTSQDTARANPDSSWG